MGTIRIIGAPEQALAESQARTRSKGMFDANTL